MRSALRAVAAISAWLALAPVARAEVQVSIRSGRVTIVAKDATVRQILAEWGRVGKTRIVNVERVPGAPLTLELRDVAEAEALDVLLRSLSGYMAAPRAGLVSADASVFDAIVVMPTVAAARAASSGPSGAPAAFSSPGFTQNNDDEQDGNAPVRPGGVAPVRPPIFSTFPSPQPGNANTTAPRPMLPVVRPGVVQAPQNINPVPVERLINDANPPPTAAPSASPGGFVGTSAPGMLPPAASQPGQVVQPQRPNGE